MAADNVAVARPGNRADDGPALTRGLRAPVNREMVLGARIRMRGEADMVGAIRASHGKQTYK